MNVRFRPFTPKTPTPLAICAYIPAEDHWIVELRPEEEKYVVVWREETYQIWEGTPEDD